MQLIERGELDVSRWERLREQDASATLFSSVAYLDATAENWCVLVSADFSCGIALPYTVRLGVKTLYTPLFCRQLEFLGPGCRVESAYALLRHYFPTINAVFRQELPGIPPQAKKYQEIRPGKRQELHTQAKRMLRKFLKSGFELRVSDDPKPVFEWIESELMHKVPAFDKLYINKLKELVSTLLKQGNLQVMHICSDAGVEGGMFFMHGRGRVIYLKGAASEAAKKHGAMYALMDQKIRETLACGEVFDFGGSDVPGVRRFNLNLGGADQVCYRYMIDNGPFWFRMLKKIRTTWKGK